MSLIGALRVGIRCDGGSVAAVTFEAPRSVPLERLLGGRSPAEATAILGTLFPLCGNAQAAASAAAIEAALDLDLPLGERRARSAIVTVEALREHAARISVDWPGFIGAEADVAPFASMQRAVKAMREALFRDAPPFAPGTSTVAAQPGVALIVAQIRETLSRLILGNDDADWSAFGALAAIERWVGGATTPAARLVAKASGPATAMADRSATAEDGTPFGRLQGHPSVRAVNASRGELAARLVARILEAIALLHSLEIFAAGGHPDDVLHSGRNGDSVSGWAQVQVARGTLRHEVRLDGGRIAAYRIAAPTTANFSPGAAAELALMRLAGVDRNEIDWRARLTVLEFDPCVAHEVGVS